MGATAALLISMFLTVIAKEASPTSAKYERVMNEMGSMDDESLLDILKSAGYSDVTLGERLDPSFEGKHSDGNMSVDEEEFPSEFTFGHSCHTVDMKMMPKHMRDKGAKIVSGDASKEGNGQILLETNEDIVVDRRALRKLNNQVQGKLNAKVNSRVDEAVQLSRELSAGAQMQLDGEQFVRAKKFGAKKFGAKKFGAKKLAKKAGKKATGGQGGSTDLDCECKPYECHCNKQCFCRLSTDKFEGTHFPPEANCPVCPICAKPNKEDPKNGKGPMTNMEQDFKCSCNMDGVGGPGISEGGYMECDCKVADCTCSKECQCKKTGGLPEFKETAHSIKVDEKDIKRAEDVHKNMKVQGNKPTPPQVTKQPKLQEAQSKSSSNGRESHDGAQVQQHAASDVTSAKGKTAEIRDVIYG